MMARFVQKSSLLSQGDRRIFDQKGLVAIVLGRRKGCTDCWLLLLLLLRMACRRLETVACFRASPASENLGLAFPSLQRVQRLAFCQDLGRNVAVVGKCQGCVDPRSSVPTPSPWPTALSKAFWAYGDVSQAQSKMVGPSRGANRGSMTCNLSTGDPMRVFPSRVTIRSSLFYVRRTQKTKKAT
jgi:hypothetical protein